MHSIVVPAYNCAKWIDMTIESVLNQTYRNYECIIVNDGSSDNTLVKVQRWAEIDSRVKVISIRNGGVSNARNIGFEASSGEWVSFLDSDDIWLPERLDLIEASCRIVDDDVGIIHHSMKVIDGYGNPTGKLLSGLSGCVLNDLLYWEKTVVPSPSSCAFRRDAINMVGLWDIRLSTAADQEMYFRVANTYKFEKIEMPLGQYRVHDNNMHKNIPVMEADHRRAFDIASDLRLFSSNRFRNICYCKLYDIVAFSWLANRSSMYNAIRCLAISFAFSPVHFAQLQVNRIARIWRRIK